MEAATSSLRAPWFSSGCTSLLANTPQREAMVYSFSLRSAASFICSGVSGARSVQGVSWKSFSITIAGTMSPSGWGLGSMAITLPETVAWMGAETGAGLSAIF